MKLQVRYIGKRMLYAILTVFVLTTITFILMHMLPGNPFSGSKALKPAVQEALTAKYGLDKPVFEQYAVYMRNIVRGDLGNSLISGRAVTDIIAKAFPVSLELGLRSLIFAVSIGLLMGIAAAMKRGKAWDTGIMFLALLGVSVPSFIMGALLQYFLGVKLYQITGVRVFNIIGWTGESSKLLPSFALAFGTIAVISRMMRSSMLEVLSSDYIQTAKAKGLSKGQIIRHHCLRNAIMPVITVLGPMVAVLLTGTFAVENVFSIPGLGKYFVDSVRSNDYPVIVGTTLFFGVFIVLCNLIVDLIHSLIDPQIKLGGDDNESV